MSFLQKLVGCLGRLLISSVFLFSVIVEYLTWPSVWQLFVSTVERWQIMYQGYPHMSAVFTFVIHWAPFILIGALLVKSIGALMLFFGWRVRLAAVLLLLFLLPTTIIVHDFWHLNAGMGCPETEIFLRNTGLIGALLLVLAYGKGCGSSKEKATPKNP